MKKQVQKFGKKAVAIAGVVGVVAGSLLGAAVFQPDPVVVVEQINHTVEVPVEVIKTVEVQVPVEVEKIVEVEVQSEDEVLILNELYDNNGDLSHLDFSDLDEDELDQVVDRIAFSNEIKSLAVSFVKAELADELDNEEITLADNSTYKFDESDFEKLRIDDDSDEIELDNVDFEDKDADVIVTGKFRHDDKWFSFESTVEFEDGKVEDFKVDSVTEE